MLEKIKKYVEKWNMLEAGDKVIAGVSGGADSVCLLFVLMELQKEIPFEIAVVHVNHGLRDEAAYADEEYVRELCEKYGLPCVVYWENVELIAKKRKQSLEEAGREVRREAFGRALEKFEGTKIALAHHKNDNAETLLMNLMRGSGIAGLRGILPVNGNVIRPLLAVERTEIEMYLNEKGILFCTDETNQSDKYTRNRIRNHVIPYLEREVNVKAVSHMNQAMEKLSEIQSFLEETTEKSWGQCVSEDGEKYAVRSTAFEEVPGVVKPLVLKRVLKEMTGKEKDVEASHLESIQKLFEKQVGRKIHLPYEMEAVRTYDGVVFQKKAQNTAEEKKEIELDFSEGKEGVSEWGSVKIRWRILDADEWCEDCSEKNYTKWFDYDIIKGTVSVRTRQPGDYIIIDKEGRTQKLKSYFINEKVPQEKRGEIPLIAEGNRILWIAGYRVSSAYRISKNTKQVLEIQIDEGEKLWQRQLKY